MAGKEPPSVRSSDRLPPGQKLVQNWPVLDLGVHPEVSLEQQEKLLHEQHAGAPTEAEEAEEAAEHEAEATEEPKADGETPDADENKEG